MANPEDFHKFPEPKLEVSGRNTIESPLRLLSKIAKLWQPRGAGVDEMLAATCARYALRLVGPEGSAYALADVLTEARQVVSTSIPTVAGTVAALPIVDELLYQTPAGTLGTLTWQLPSAANSRVGQRKTFYSSQILSSVSVVTVGLGTVAGTTLTAAAANTSYEYVCTSVTGTGTWLRIR